MTLVSRTDPGAADAKTVHVMQVTFGMVIGGLERVVIELCRRLDPVRYRVSICCLGTRGPLADIVEAEGIPVIVCQKQTRVAKYLRGLELARIFREHHVDLVHAHHTPALVDSAIGATLARVPLVATDHCKAYPTSWRWRILERYAAASAQRVIAVSERSKAELVEHQGISPSKIDVIPNGLDITPTRSEPPAGLREELGLSPSHVVIGTAARLEDQKGLDLLLRAAPEVLKRQPSARFVIVGGGSKERALRQEADRLGVMSHVIFTGYRLDAVDLMGTFDCFVQTSNWEGMPMTLLEAMAMGKPVVATSVGGVPEVVEHGKNGRLVANRDPHAIAEAILDVVGSPEKVKSMGAAGRARYLSEFTSARMIAKYEALYETVVAGLPAARHFVSRTTALEGTAVGPTGNAGTVKLLHSDGSKAHPIR